MVCYQFNLVASFAYKILLFLCANFYFSSGLLVDPFLAANALKEFIIRAWNWKTIDHNCSDVNCNSDHATWCVSVYALVFEKFIEMVFGQFMMQFPIELNCNKKNGLVNV